MNDPATIRRLADEMLEAWNTQDVERVLPCYTADVVYRDPNTRGEVRGADALRRYLTKLFSAWQMTWTVREVHPFRDTDGEAVLWHATFRRPGGDLVVEADGMDFVGFHGDLVARNDVYFDRAVLAPLLGLG